MQYFVIPPNGCPRCREAVGVPVAVAVGPEIRGYIARLVCPKCGLLWDDLSGSGDSPTFDDDFLSPDKGAFALEALPFTLYEGLRDYVPTLEPR